MYAASKFIFPQQLHDGTLENGVCIVPQKLINFGSMDPEPKMCISLILFSVLCIQKQNKWVLSF